MAAAVVAENRSRCLSTRTSRTISLSLTTQETLHLRQMGWREAVVTVRLRHGSACPSRLCRRAESHLLKIHLEVEERNVAGKVAAQFRVSQAQDLVLRVIRRLRDQAKTATQTGTTTKECGQLRVECRKTSRAISLDGTLSLMLNLAEVVRSRVWRKQREQKAMARLRSR